MNDKLRIAHISLPFYNGGGLVKYVKDIVNKQINDENIEYVCVFYTNNYNLILNKPNVKYKKGNLSDLFEINNFNPTTLFEGTRYPELDIENKELEDVIIKKLNKMKINIVHFHTFHGLTSNLIKRIKENNIKIIYTAHDYQPICNRITFLDKNNKYCKSIENCSICNSNAISKNKLKIRYSPISNKLKTNNYIKSKVKNIISNINRNKNKAIKTEDIRLNKVSNGIYKERAYSFVNNFNKYADKIIYSSYITKNIFESKGILKTKSELIPISNQNLMKKIENYQVKLDKEIIRFGYLGGDRKEKGYEILIRVFEKLFTNNITNWKLFLLGSGSENIHIPNSIKENVIIKGYLEESLYDNFDVLIVPSIWAETFNFVVAEGIANKKIIIASNIVGSANLYKNSGVLTYDFNNKNGLYEMIIPILIEKDKHYNIDIEKNKYYKYIDFNNHYQSIVDLYFRLLN